MIDNISGMDTEWRRGDIMVLPNKVCSDDFFFSCDLCMKIHVDVHALQINLK